MLPGGSISDKRRSWTRYCSSTYCSGTSWPPVSSIPSTSTTIPQSSFQWGICFPVLSTCPILFLLLLVLCVCKSQSPVCASCYDLCFRLSEFHIYISILSFLWMIQIGRNSTIQHKQHIWIKHHKYVLEIHQVIWSKGSIYSTLYSEHHFSFRYNAVYPMIGYEPWSNALSWFVESLHNSKIGRSLSCNNFW